MRIGLITLHRVYNYGSVLQTFATQSVFEELGHEVQVIDYITQQRTMKRIFFTQSTNGALKGAAYRIAKVFSLLLKEMTFGFFVRKKLNLTKKYITADDLQADPPQADIYVTGSDQTWNSTYNEGVDRGFYLDFVPEDARRIAYVASFGKKELAADETELTKKYIDRYTALSVRENTAVEILSKLGRDDAIQLIDPTLMLKKEKWIRLASKRLVKEPYLILMLLYNEDNHATEYARRIADEKGLKLIKISWEMIKPAMVDRLFTHRSPADFLSLFYHADFVVTNSFHGLAFSINLGKQFIVVPRNEFNSRIESLLLLTGLKDRMVSSFEQLKICQETIQYDQVEKMLEEERGKAYEFLRKNLTV